MKKFKALFAAVAALALGTSMFVGCGGDGDDNTPCTHGALQKVDGHDASCFEEGNYAYYKCGDCGELFSDKNATKPTTAQDVKIEKTRHDMHKYEEQVAGYDEYYFCNTCGRYYLDLAGNSEIPYDEMTDSSVEPEAIADGWRDPAGADAENRDFTLRCYIGWTSEKGFSDFPAGSTVWVNVNLNRKITLSGDGWYNFGVAYNKEYGLQYKDFGVGHLTKVAPEFTELFVRNGGIWVRVVREGTNCSFYFEDKYGIPIFISTNADFKEDEALYRFACNSPEDGIVAGYTRAPTQAQICWNIANPRCVFGNN